MEVATASIILKELREFRAENDKKWKENDKRWEENDRRWEENNKRWEENERRWIENDKKLEQINQRIDETNQRIDETNQRIDKTNKRIDETNQRLDNTNERVEILEKGRVKDRRDILVVLDTMQKSIDNQFKEMKEYMDAKFEKIFALQRYNDIEHEEFKKILYKHDKRLDFHNARLTTFEEWKEQFERGECTAV